MKRIVTTTHISSIKYSAMSQNLKGVSGNTQIDLTAIAKGTYLITLYDTFNVPLYTHR